MRALGGARSSRAAGRRHSNTCEEMPDVLLGVIVGWGLTAIVEVGRAWWRNQESERERKTALRRAARLILEDLLVAAKGTASNKDKPDPFQVHISKQPLPTNTWNENREILAVAPEAAEEWETIAAAFARINELNWTMQDPRERPLHELEDLLTGIGEIHELILKAEAGLRRLAAS